MAEEVKQGRGGRRAGAGRKSADGAVIVARADITMDQATYDLWLELGDGNFSLGARRAVAELLALRLKHQRPPAQLQSVAKPAGVVNRFLRS